MVLKFNKTRNHEFMYADTSILLVTVSAYKKSPVTLNMLIEVGDFINRDIFEYEELSGGLYRLIEAGYILKKEHGFIPTKKTLVLFKNIYAKTKTILKLLDFVRIELGAPEWSEDYDPTNAAKGIAYNIINKKIYNEAINAYTNKYSKFLRTIPNKKHKPNKS